MQMEKEPIELIFCDNFKKAELEPLCLRILKHFQAPNYSLIVIFDDCERKEFESHGAEFCGFFIPIREHTDKFGSDSVTMQWPDDILKHIYIDQELRCDVLIYLRYRTCKSATGTAITFAHELQHLMQYGFSYKVWRACFDIRSVTGGSAKFPWDIPDEHDAQVVSRKIACGDDICGKQEVWRYAQEQIELGRDPEKWKFFIGLDAEVPFNFLDATIPLVDVHRDALKEIHNDDGGPDYDEDIWW